MENRNKLPLIPENTKILDITFLKCLGKGTFGEVYLSIRDGKNGYFATKVLRKDKMNKPSLKTRLRTEIEILKKLKHPNIYQLLDIKETPTFYLLVTEYVNGGSLSDCLKKYIQTYKKPFPESIVQHIMRQIIDAFKYIHRNNIMHRDIKLENIMIHYDNVNDKNNLNNLLRAKVKIIDFGLAIQGFGKTVLGSPLTMDPLILEKYKKSLPSKICKDLIYDQKVDIWSIGVICYQMLIGKSVFDAKTLGDLVKKVEEGTYSVPTSLSREIVSFLNGMLQYKSEKRLSAERLYNHPFLTRNVREFHKIDTKRVSHKIDNKGLNINVKKNTTIWSIFNQADETKLLNIQGEGDIDNLQLKKVHSLEQSSKIPSTLNSSGNGSDYSVISNNSSISNTHFVPKVEDYHHNFNPNAGNIGNSFYGQNMHISNNIQNPSNLQNQNFRIQQQGYPLAYTNTYPNNRMNNNYNLNQNISNSGSQGNHGINTGINNNGYNNSPNNTVPMYNDESNQQNVCLIM